MSYKEKSTLCSSSPPLYNFAALLLLSPFLLMYTFARLQEKKDFCIIQGSFDRDTLLEQRLLSSYWDVTTAAKCR